MNRAESGAYDIAAITFDARFVSPDATAKPSTAWVRPARAAALMASDSLALILSAVTAYAVWALPVQRQPASMYFDLLFLLPLFLGAYSVTGLYPGFGIGAVETLRRLSIQTSLVYLVIAAFSFAAKLPATYSRATFAIAWVLSLGAVPLARYFVLSRVKQQRWWCEPVLLVGTGKSAARAMRLLSDAKSLGYRTVAALSLNASAPNEVSELPVAESLEAAERLGAQGVRTVLVTDGDALRNPRLLSFLQTHFRSVIVLPPEDTLPCEGVVVRNLGGFLGLEFRNQLLIRRNMMLKRSVDLLLGSAALLFAAPVILVVAATVKMTSRGGSPFYAQEREGLDGERINVWKIRSMYPDAEARLFQHLATHPEARREWDRNCKLKDDPRILPVIGKFMRRFSLDELPQIAQVVLGQLSLVGPRPFPEYHLDRFDPEFREFRRKVRPGLSGLWQISSRSDGRLEDQQRLDTHYIRNWSLWIDLYILARTATVVLTGRGAY